MKGALPPSSSERRWTLGAEGVGRRGEERGERRGRKGEVKI